MWGRDCRPDAATIRLALRWCDRAADDVEAAIESASASDDRSALKSRLGKIQSGRRLLAQLFVVDQPGDCDDRPLRIIGKDAPRALHARVDLVLPHLTDASLAQIGAALNANVFRHNRARSRQLRMSRAKDGSIEFGWLLETARDGSTPADITTLRASDIAILARGGGERFSLVQFFNAGSFQASFTAGVVEQAQKLGLAMNRRDPADGDIGAMKQRIDAIIADPRTAGLIVHSGDALQLHPLIARARRAGKAVVTSNLLAPPMNTPAIVLDDIAAGAMLAEALLQNARTAGRSATPGRLDAQRRSASIRPENPPSADAGEESPTHRRTVLLVGGGANELPHMRLRQHGFLDALTSRNNIATVEVEGSLQLIAGTLRSRRVDAVVAFYDDVTRFAAQAIDLVDQSDRVALYGVDLGDVEMESMEASEAWKASIAFDAHSMGAAAARLLAAALRLPRWTSRQRFPFTIPAALVRRDDVLKLRDRTARGLRDERPELTHTTNNIVRLT